jgi:hypothetical protein
MPSSRVFLSRNGWFTLCFRLPLDYRTRFPLLLTLSETIQPLQIPIQPSNSTIQCFLLYVLKKLMLPCPMHSAPTLIYPDAGAAGSPLLSGGPSHSCGAGRNRYIASSPAYSQSRANVTMDHAITTPLFLITSLQPLCFHVIAHSFPQWRSAIRCAFNNLRTLSINTGVSPSSIPIQNFSASVSLYLRGKSHVLSSLQPLVPLFALFSALRSFVFNRLQPLFPKHPGWGYLDLWTSMLFDAQNVRQPSATWTRRAHPTIIAASSRFQVHG